MLFARSLVLTLLQGRLREALGPERVKSKETRGSGPRSSRKRYVGTVHRWGHGRASSSGVSSLRKCASGVLPNRDDDEFTAKITHQAMLHWPERVEGASTETG